MNSFKNQSISELKKILSSCNIKVTRKNHNKPHYLRLIGDYCEEQDIIDFIGKRKASESDSRSVETKLVKKVTAKRTPKTELTVVPLKTVNMVQSIFVEEITKDNIGSQLVVVLSVTSFAYLLTFLLVNRPDDLAAVLHTISIKLHDLLHCSEFPLLLSSIITVLLGGYIIYRRYTQNERRAREITSELKKDDKDTFDESDLIQKAVDLYDLKAEETKELLVFVADCLDESESFSRICAGTFIWSRVLRRELIK